MLHVVLLQPLLLKVEYVACSVDMTFSIWIKRFIDDMELNIINGPIQIYCDNDSAIRLIKIGADSPKGRHIDVDYHNILYIVERGETMVDYMPSANMMADPLTKWKEYKVIFKAYKLNET